MSSKPQVLVETKELGGGGRVATVTVDNESKLNVVNTPLLDQLIGALRTQAEDSDLRVLVIRGAGERAWIGGADIAEMVDLTPETARTFITLLHEACRAIEDVPVPVIARISGYCLGGGLELAAACDLRIAAEGSLFGMPEVRVGLPSVIEAALLPRLIGWGKAMEMIYTAATLDGPEALACGLIGKLVAPAKLDAAVGQWVDAIAEAGPRAIRLQKQLVREWARLPIDRAIEAGIEPLGRAFETDEPTWLMRAFLNRKRGD